MTDWPKLYIVLLTSAKDPDGPRAKYAEAALRSVLTDMSYAGQTSVHVADDGSPQVHRDRMCAIAGGFDHVHGVTVSNAEGRGYGESFNLATQVTHQHADLILPLEDDWIVEHPFSLDGYVQALAAATLESAVGCIRLGYLGFTQELRGRVISLAGKPLLLLDPESPEPHVFAGHPRLETVAWERWVGPWPVDPLTPIDAGTTEFIVSSRDNARRGVAWPLDGGKFSHIGTVQAREDQLPPIAEIKERPARTKKPIKAGVE